MTPEEISKRLRHIHNTLGLIDRSDLNSSIRSLLAGCEDDISDILIVLGRKRIIKGITETAAWPESTDECWKAIR